MQLQTGNTPPIIANKGRGNRTYEHQREGTHVSRNFLLPTVTKRMKTRKRKIRENENGSCPILMSRRKRVARNNFSPE